jgi:excisionase family DNA binding protein
MRQESRRKKMQTAQLIDVRERESALRAYNALTTHAPKHSEHNEVTIQIHGTIPNLVHIPAPAFDLLVSILREMAAGHSITLVPDHKLLTTQEAADILNVSRPYFTKLLKTGKLPYVEVGQHKRVKAGDVMKYKQAQREESEKKMQELAELSQNLDMGY